eukprot:gnl/MRDRNA2_/MRDRNA2_114103_c0_seq1.p1 gnl/MRDRNA2_/MRDRNA2_114103_c0~~gnl/MRDRNA2_/MRDRNA2_114103_c0_seq1.p1  ORF type:complete len:198 (+),score=57.62 gnl/MRDRNA2_/MRDRNA2_114103_c0_seq1:93-686(+)
MAENRSRSLVCNTENPQSTREAKILQLEAKLHSLHKDTCELKYRLQSSEEEGKELQSRHAKEREADMLRHSQCLEMERSSWQLMKEQIQAAHREQAEIKSHMDQELSKQRKLEQELQLRSVAQPEAQQTCNELVQSPVHVLGTRPAQEEQLLLEALMRNTKLAEEISQLQREKKEWDKQRQRIGESLELARAVAPSS